MIRQHHGTCEGRICRSGCRCPGRGGAGQRLDATARAAVDAGDHVEAAVDRRVGRLDRGAIELEDTGRGRSYLAKGPFAS